MMKLAVIVALARFLAYPRRRGNSFGWVIAAVLIAVIPVFLILKQPDLGTSIIFFILLLSLLFWTGLSVYLILFLITPLLSLILAFHWIPWGLFFLGLLIAMFYIRPGKWLGSLVIAVNLMVGVITPLLWNNLHDYQKDRILSFIDPRKDPLGAGYQLIQSKVALGSGGLTGKGYLHSSQARLEFLPMQHTDFVFSVQGEEFGLWGCMIILFLLGYVAYLGIGVANKARNNFASSLAWGIITVLIAQAVINIGMTVGLLPVTGIPLPFLSYGGSAMLVNWIMWGILMNISSHWQEY
jgi:rod shape determining protein RodA